MSNLTEKEILKLNEIKKIIIGECSKKEASERLGITIRQMKEIWDSFIKIDIKKVKRKYQII